MTKGKIHLISCRHLLWDSYLDFLWSAKRTRCFKGEIYLSLKLGSENESDAHESAYFSLLSIVGTWID